jgi:hypothetical protein
MLKIGGRRSTPPSGLALSLTEFPEKETARRASREE